MISGSVFLFQDDPRVRRRVSEGGRGLRPPRYDENGNDGIETLLTISEQQSSLDQCSYRGYLVLGAHLVSQEVPRILYPRQVQIQAQ